ncbi:hypothetical protein A3715_16560 [Oleiphilus sp. HI0009]|uniref:nucleoside 2-deoxyribosyltransferase n=3 Tax=Oleiphilus TaxID=141450 RepID=UPI0007C37A5A|nr:MULTISPECIES: nucleoside 2-deoxyribosyltransferase [unclassified Oleiphilus]KZX75714.1 hypothetical protein A3715_22625 [Oleiphilus sp. HI0009]KZX86214.1 hypothetical protein A3715_16560 [Oleiphilus sp. HI0009]KZY67078.1 hypothetical protein A3738_05185 [Oleiphilus sp. HI0066]KZY71162.1 hypothetical protein A3739_05580 [Oleiphilus sp. HI0067]KZZ57689.1 hypothetical protein A3762_09230 [Oleiphilus sp. HI0125]
MTQERSTIYLAGPDVFFQDDSGEIKKQLCHDAGFTPLFPLDNEIKRADPAPDIFQANIDMIDRCHIVMANITPFRGPSCDLGTAFEIGYARKAGKKVFCYSSDSRELKQRISEDFPHFLQDGMSIEDFGYIDNLMIGCSAPIDCIDDRDDKAALKAFQCALERAQSEQQSEYLS